MENNNCTIAEYFTIPSKGLIYNQQVAPDIKMRSMTTIEEMKRLSPSEYAYRNLSDVIDDCIIGDVGISSYDMCIGDYQEQQADLKQWQSCKQRYGIRERYNSFLEFL